MGRKKKEVKKEANVTVEETRSPEAIALDKKLADLQNKYRVAIKNKQDLIKQLNTLNEEITKMSGAYQALMELKQESQPAPEVEPEPETADEGEKAEEKVEEKAEE